MFRLRRKSKSQAVPENDTMFADPEGPQTRKQSEGLPPSSVAQLAERSAVNRMVVGSSPTRGANTEKPLSKGLLSLRGR